MKKEKKIEIEIKEIIQKNRELWEAGLLNHKIMAEMKKRYPEFPNAYWYILLDNLAKESE